MQLGCGLQRAMRRRCCQKFHNLQSDEMPSPKASERPSSRRDYLNERSGTLLRRAGSAVQGRLTETTNLFRSPMNTIENIRTPVIWVDRLPP